MEKITPEMYALLLKLMRLIEQNLPDVAGKGTEIYIKSQYGTEAITN